MANQTLVPIRTVSDFYANIKPEECYPFKHTLCNITLSAFEVYVGLINTKIEDGSQRLEDDGKSGRL
ncbi:hypothetical protein T4B_480 [Trichinella pseudospiralis]|uniref:Uncharacterized protein n=1 Tax=Trichinella pseudospiralis TaxID=6337 RepID=A0A0V1GMH1_TRIPS|nr:hypothetical protein T4B_480 [Trichinella pseudospiralis]